MRRYGAEGQRLFRLAHGIDDRDIVPDRETKSVSAETTFNTDIAELRPLEQQLWLLTERVSRRLKAGELSGSTVTLKLKSADFRLKTRARSLPDPTQLAEKIFAAGRDLLAHEIDGTRYRLIGIGVSALEGADVADPAGLLDPVTTRSAAAERALDRVRERFGRDAAMKGIAFDAATTMTFDRAILRRTGSTSPDCAPQQDFLHLERGHLAGNDKIVVVERQGRGRCRSRTARSRSHRPASVRRRRLCALSK